MSWANKGSSSSGPAEEVIFDDGGTGLFDACVARFGARGWTVWCDAYHSVWVQNADASHAVGIARWMPESLAFERIFADVEAKMKRAEAAPGA